MKRKAAKMRFISEVTAEEKSVEEGNYVTLAELYKNENAEKIIDAANSEQKDYSNWQRDFFDQMTKEQIEKEALEYIASNPYEGDPATII